MAYGRPFAYDPTGSTIPTGTQKFGDLLIGEDLTLDYANDYAGYKWYNGPDESIYWVIARYYSGATQNFDFWGAVKTNDAIEPNLTGMTYYLSNFTELIDNPRGCKTWLNDNNYWTSYGESTSPLILNLDATSYLSLTAPKSSATQWLDISGHINDATFSGATEYTSNPEKMQLTGFNFFVVNNNIDLLSPTNYTKIIWVNYSSLGNSTDILSGRYVDGGSSNFHRLWAGDSSYGSYKFRAGHTGSGDTVESTTIVSANTWYCVAVTFDTTNGWSLYVNGSSEDTNSDTTTFSYTGTGAGSGAIQVGAFNQANKMSGYVSQVRVYNSALTQTQIQEFYNQTRNIYEATPILTDGLKLQLDASISSSFTTGTTKWYDISGLGNNGDFNNTITYSGDASGSFVFDSGSGYIEIPTSSSLNLGPSSTFATIQMWVKISNFSSDIPYILQKYDNSLGGYYIGTTTRKIPENTPLDLKNQIFMGNFGKLNESDPFPSGNYIGTYNSGYTAYTYPSYSNNDWVFVTFQVANSVSPGFMVGLAFTGNSQFQQTSFQVGNRNNDKPLVIGNNYPQGVSSFSAFSGSIGAVYLYQKLLTNSEILQNYNATNDRFSEPDITPSPTPTQTITPTFTPTATITPTPSITPTQTVTPTNTVTYTPTPTPSSTPASSSFTSFTFTSGGISGRTGPTLVQLLSSYDTTTYPWLNDTNEFNMLTNGIQLWTVPVTGNYRITARGAQGAPTLPTAGGRGAIITGEFALNAGDKLQILVGQTSSIAAPRLYRSSAGGGGTFVVKYTGNVNVEADILVIAGGGGGSGSSPIPTQVDAQTGTTGGRAIMNGLNGGGTGGINGNGGNLGNASSNGAGGGFLTDGTPSSSASGLSFLNAGLGGATNTTYAPTGGGFGGGGAPNNGDLNRFSGGGGYSGGGASNTGTSSAQSNSGGGGGGSYNSGSNQSNTGGSSGNYSSGSVTIELL